MRITVNVSVKIPDEALVDVITKALRERLNGGSAWLKTLRRLSRGPLPDSGAWYESIHTWRAHNIKLEANVVGRGKVLVLREDIERGLARLVLDYPETYKAIAGGHGTAADGDRLLQCIILCDVKHKQESESLLG